MSKIRVCFMGTPEFAVKCLQALLVDDHFEVVGVVTQPDRPAGRKLVLTPSPVKVLAQAHNLKVLSPESLKNNKTMVDSILSWRAEVAVVVAFGQILTEDFMQSFPFGAVNVHASLLPRWRGAAPIQRAIQYGDSESGVCLQKMVKKLDAGDVIGMRKIKIDQDMDAQMLHDQLAFLGSDMLRVELMDYIRGNLIGKTQDESLVTYAKKIEKSESEIKWTQSALEINNQIKAFIMGPGSYTLLNGKKVKIHLSNVVNQDQTFPENQAGSIDSISENEIIVRTGKGLLSIFELQPESRNKMKVKDFQLGHNLKVGDFLK